MRRETWKITFTNSNNILYAYGKKDELLDQLTARQLVEMNTAEIFNRPDDKTKHKPLTREDIINAGKNRARTTTPKK